MSSTVSTHHPSPLDHRDSSVSKVCDFGLDDQGSVPSIVFATVSLALESQSASFFLRITGYFHESKAKGARSLSLASDSEVYSTAQSATIDEVGCVYHFIRMWKEVVVAISSVQCQQRKILKKKEMRKEEHLNLLLTVVVYKGIYL
jgi:hypothetical protein